MDFIGAVYRHLTEAPAILLRFVGSVPEEGCSSWVFLGELLSSRVRIRFPVDSVFLDYALEMPEEFIERETAFVLRVSP